MLKDGFLRFCDDPEIACCKGEAELKQLRKENAALRAELERYREAEDEGRLIPKIPDVIYFKWDNKIYESRIEGINGQLRKKFYWYADIITSEPSRRTIFGHSLNDDWFLDRASAEAARKEQEEG